MFSKIWTKKSTNASSQACDTVQQLADALQNADAVVIGAGAGLSTSAGFVYNGKRFALHFGDFAEKYKVTDMYSGGFYPYRTFEEHWAYWSRYIWINRYMDAPKPVYDRLLALVRDKDYFVLTTNVDHCFQKAGFDKHRLFYTQGDYGLFQCGEPCHKETYDNEAVIRQMVLSQGYEIAEDRSLRLPDGVQPKMVVPTELVPHCPRCGKPMSMNLRADDTFAEDAGWHRAAERYSEFLRRHQHVNTLFLELGVGFNTPGIIKYSFWNMTDRWQQATYACLNFGEACVPDEIKQRSICINGDVGEVLSKISESRL